MSRNLQHRIALRWLIAPVVAAIVGSFAGYPYSSSAQDGGDDPKDYPTTVEHWTRSPAGNVSNATPLSQAELVAITEKVLQRRETEDARANNNARSNEPRRPEEPLAETSLDSEPKVHGTASAFIIGKNTQNPRAKDPIVGNTLAEPSAANDGKHVFYAGNLRHAEYSTDGGSTWTAVPIPVGPASAPTAWGDTDVIYDQARGLTVWSMLYLNSSRTHGIVRLGVRRTVPGAAGADTCAYYIDAGSTIFMDYPHLGISNDFLYLATNNPGAGKTGGQVRRFSLDELYDCVPTLTSNTFTYDGSVTGKRIFVPVDGARETMYWGALETTTSFRIFSWPESSTTVSSVLKPGLAESKFVNPDCHGGANNTDWIEKSTAWSITGFRLRGAVGANKLTFLWNVGPDSSHTQGHVHAAVFRESDKTLLAQPHIFNSGFCYGFPNISANERGDLGLTIAAGGKASGGGPAVQGYVGIDDDFTQACLPICSPYKWEIFPAPVAIGTHNPPDSRYGDYLTIHPHEPCDNFWAATSYALNGGTTIANVNARYVEFGRGRDNKCYTGWRNGVRTP